MLFNSSDTTFYGEAGDRIAQGVFAHYYKGKFIQSTQENLSKTERGEGGFGHTGLK